ncbi:MAG TPA: hypothetical protein GXZ60_15870 [Intrasporangiaceae bacterium]|nr:hypothetical protein [Intrasporangiaceae bacterium]
MKTTTPTPREQALTDLIQPDCAHSGEYLPDQIGYDERSLPTRCPSWCSGGHAEYMHECRLSLFEADLDSTQF